MDRTRFGYREYHIHCHSAWLALPDGLYRPVFPYSRRLGAEQFVEHGNGSYSPCTCHPQPTPRDVGLIIHSDRGVQYARRKFRKVLAKHRFVQRMSAKGDCWDNAVAESFFGIIKSELIHHERFKGPQDTLEAIFEYIEDILQSKTQTFDIGLQNARSI